MKTRILGKKREKTPHKTRLRVPFMCGTQTIFNYFLEWKLEGIHKSTESLNIRLDWFCRILNFQKKLSITILTLVLFFYETIDPTLRLSH
jgi:hypothetical protein